MQDAANNNIFCAVDIEATGFDPLTEEILEIGFVFFKLGEKGFETLDEWSQVFKPSKEVSAKILALTGITEDEIASAPKLSEHHNFVQEKLATAILVGHSVGVDVRYLEANGFKLSGKYLDTLELVQFVLPTRHSYNLENLMHYFSIGHENAHRALADAKASMKLLEKLLQRFNSFPEEVKQMVSKITDGFEFVWHQMLENGFSPLSENLPRLAKFDTERVQPPIKTGTIVSFGLNVPYRQMVLESAARGSTSVLFATPQKEQLLQLWQEGLGTAIFSGEDNFDVEKYNGLLAKKQTNADLAKFLAKVTVWKGINWQTKTVIDLNLSFAGNQFRSLITGAEADPSDASKVLLCDHKTLLTLKKQPHLAQHLIVDGLSEFENQLTARIGRRASWGGVIRQLTSIYNPETNFGEVHLAKQVIDLLTATDLFFGLSVMTLESNFGNKQQVTKKELEQNSKAYRTIQMAAENYADKLAVFAENNGYDYLKTFTDSLLSFFQEEDDRVKWIDFGQRFCVFNNLPLRIEKLARSVIENFSGITFVDTLGADLVEYFQKRLGLTEFSQESHPGERELQSKIVFGKAISEKEIIESLPEYLPLALVLPTYKSIKEFYDANFRRLKDSASVFAEGYSGGVNKMFYNFSSSSAGMIILTTKLAVRSGRQALPAKQLILGELTDEVSGGVYGSAVQKYMADLGLPAGELNHLESLHKVIRLFYNASLAGITLTALKDENLLKSIQKYLKSLGFTKFSKLSEK